MRRRVDTAAQPGKQCEADPECSGHTAQNERRREARHRDSRADASSSQLQTHLPSQPEGIDRT